MELLFYYLKKFWMEFKEVIYKFTILVSSSDAWLRIKLIEAYRLQALLYFLNSKCCWAQEIWKADHQKLEESQGNLCIQFVLFPV